MPSEHSQDANDDMSSHSAQSIHSKESEKYERPSTKYGLPTLLPTDTEFAQYRCTLQIDETVVSDSFGTELTDLKVSVAMEKSTDMRGNLIISVRATLNTTNKRKNQGKFNEHKATFEIPYRTITGIKKSLSTLEEKEIPGTLVDKIKNAKKGVMKLEFKTSQALPQNPKIPDLITPEVTGGLVRMMRALESKGEKTFTLFIRVTGSEKINHTAFSLNKFVDAWREEQDDDPYDIWFSKCPRTSSLTKGNILKANERPGMKIQRAKTVFHDQRDYTLRQVMGITYEQEHQFREHLMMKKQTFEARAVALPAFHSDGIPTKYLLFVDFTDHKVEVPDKDAQVLVTMQLPLPFPQRHHATNVLVEKQIVRTIPTKSAPPSPNLSPAFNFTLDDLKSYDRTKGSFSIGGLVRDKSIASNVNVEPLNYNQDTTNHVDCPADQRVIFPACKLKPVITVEGINALAETKVDIEDTYAENPSTKNNGNTKSISKGDEEVPDEGNDNEPTSANRNKWNGHRTDLPVLLLTPGTVTFVIDRCLEMGWNGPKELRPYVQTVVPSVDMDEGTSTEELRAMIAVCKPFKVQIVPQYTNQEWQDQVRVISEISHGKDRSQRQQKQKEYLLGNYKGEVFYDDIRTLNPKGFNFHTGCNSAQKGVWEGLSRCKMGIARVEGCTGSGKTMTVLTAAAECLAAAGSSGNREKFMYVTNTNKGVDDAAKRFVGIFKSVDEKYPDIGANELKIIRCHGIKNEKSHILKEFIGGNITQKWTMSTTLENDIIAGYYLLKIQCIDKEARQKGDPRRKLQDLSLAEAMLDYIKNSATEDCMSLTGHLEEKDVEVRSNTNFRNRISILLNNIMAIVLASADAIFTTPANAAKVNLSANFQPAIIVFDEAGKSTEPSCLTMLALFEPKIYILVGDRNQLGPVIKSISKDRPEITALQNPLASQLEYTLFDRLDDIGHESEFIYINERSEGDINDFPSNQFYKGLMKIPKKSDSVKLKAARAHMKHFVSTDIKSNCAFVSVAARHEFAPGSSSLFNLDYAHVTMNLIKDMFRSPFFVGNITIICMYVGQEAVYRNLLAKFDNSSRSKRRFLSNNERLDLADDRRLKLDERFTNRLLNLDNPYPVEPITVDVRTTGTSIGFQNDTIILDLTRDSGAGFLGESRRLNVALTRAKTMLLIVGNTKMLEQMEYAHKTGHSKHLNALIKYYQDHKRIATRYSATQLAKMECKNCQQTGHKSADCLEERKDGEKGKKCHGCGGPHIKKNCPDKGKSTSVWCKHCKNNTHNTNQCPNKSCFSCGSTGHMAKTCVLSAQDAARAKALKKLNDQHEAVLHNNFIDPTLLEGYDPDASEDVTDERTEASKAVDNAGEHSEWGTVNDEKTTEIVSCGGGTKDDILW